MTTETPVLEIDDLRVRFGDVEAVRGVSLVVPRGRKIGLVGESGSGKSVTALSVMRLVPGAQTTGAISLHGENLLALDARRLQRVRGGTLAMIYQDPMSSLNPVMTVGAQIVEALRLHSDLSRTAARRRAIELLDEVGVSRPEMRVTQYPHEFSGGMRQRVMIAIALAGEPDVLIADEPTTALDVTTQARIIDLLDDIVRDRGTAVMLITHDLGVAAGFCDELHVMREGRIIESADADALYAHPQEPYTRRLLSAVVDFTADTDRPITLLPLTDSVEAQDAAEPVAAPTPPPTGDVLVEVRNLTKQFGSGSGRVVAADDISFSIRRGETFGLVGESGSGKSTVSKSILGLSRLDNGQVVFDGIDILSQRGEKMRELRSRMQIVFQDPFAALNRRHTVEQLIQAPLTAHGVPRDERRRRIDEMLDLVGLGTRFSQRYPREMSGGQCQRVAIARALSLKPDLVILDESVSALDVSIQAQILNLLRRLQAELGLTYLFVSHDLAVIRYMCQNIAVMKQGRVVEQGSREDLFQNASDPYTLALLDAVPIANPIIERERRAARAHREVTS